MEIAFPSLLGPQGVNHEHRGEHQDQAIIPRGSPTPERAQQAMPGICAVRLSAVGTAGAYDAGMPEEPGRSSQGSGSRGTRENGQIGQGVWAGMPMPRVTPS